MKEDLLKIINHYGVSNQLKKLSEEIHELQEAIIKHENNLDTKEHITEEMADVFVVLNQFVEYYKINYEDFTKIREYKIKRQLKRMKKEEILDKVERKYLTGVIEPFRDRVTSIRKCMIDYEDDTYENICITTENGNNIEFTWLPNFESGSMYKGMKLNKDYTIKELGL